MIMIMFLLCFTITTGASPKSDPIEVEGGMLVPYNLSPDR